MRLAAMRYWGCGTEYSVSEFDLVSTFYPKLGDPRGGGNSLSLKALELGTVGSSATPMPPVASSTQ